ncbi:MAG: P-loop NTPase fold protein [Methyloceanibacter sp.]
MPTTFALEILERVKHFFSVPNVHFVLGVHLHQLRNSVIVAYGPNIDAQTYLQKFIHLTFHLVDRERTVTRFTEYLEKSMDFKPQDQDIVARTTELVHHVAERRNLSLRAIERIMTNLALALVYTPENVLRPPPILAGLCILKVITPELFQKAKRGQLAYAEVREALKLVESSEEQGISDWYATWWRFCTDESFDQSEAQQFGRSLFQYNIERTEIVPHVANAVIDRLTSR